MTRNAKGTAQSSRSWPFWMAIVPAMVELPIWNEIVALSGAFHIRLGLAAGYFSL